MLRTTSVSGSLDCVCQQKVCCKTPSRKRGGIKVFALQANCAIFCLCDSEQFDVGLLHSINRLDRVERLGSATSFTNTSS